VQVHDALKRHFELRPMSVFSAGDFDKAKSKLESKP
jgi:hypothetical protein